MKTDVRVRMISLTDADELSWLNQDLTAVKKRPSFETANKKCFKK
jgi:hypothetical protein